jgi:hypothetical protein
MTPTLATEALAPQLLRYGVTILGSLLTGAGLASEADMQIIAGALMALLPPLYRIVTVVTDRRRLKP